MKFVDIFTNVIDQRLRLARDILLLDVKTQFKLDIPWSPNRPVSRQNKNSFNIVEQYW